MGGFLFACFQERAAGALANLAADDKCSMEVALAGGVHALVMLARICKFEGVQEQVVLHWFQIWGEAPWFIISVSLALYFPEICLETKYLKFCMCSKKIEFL